MNIFSFDKQPGRTAHINEEEYLFFSGYAYLGMNHVAAFTELVKEGIDKYGLLFPSSRISNTRLNLFEAFEFLLSAITGREETVCFSSGFTAGRAATSLFSDLENAPGAHPSISKNNVADKSFNEWSAEYIQKINIAETLCQPAFAADSVNILNAEVHDFSFLKNTDTILTAIIDDSHGIGITGENGKGISPLVPDKKNIAYIFTYSLSKAFGLIGGAVSCSKQNAEKLRKTKEYVAGTSVSPAFMYAFIHAQELYEQQRKKLRKNCRYFSELIKDIAAIKFHPELPVFILPENTGDADLINQKIVISSFAYPDPSGKKINRIVLNALHTNEDLERLSTCLHKMLHP